MSELFRIENLSFARPGRESIKNLTLRIDRGDNIVFFGPERSGLSPLVMIILGIEEGYEGSVFFKGRPIKDFDYIEKHNYKREIGYLHGDYGLMSNMTVEGNIALPLDYHSDMSKEEINDVVGRLVKEFSLEHCRGQRPISLSSSEILRAAYARAIVMDPDLLIVDHAIVEHSMINIRSFIDNFKKRFDDQERSNIFFTYQPKIFLDFADTFIMFYNGSIVYQGDRRSFVESSDQYLSQYLNASLDGPMKIT